MVDLSTRKVAAVLSGLCPGERFWFALRSGRRPEDTHLQVSLLGSDPTRSALNAALRQQPLPVGARWSVGVGHSEQDGTLSMAAPHLGAAALPALAAAVARQHAVLPGLRRLRGCRLIALQPDGTIAAAHADAALWEGIPPAALPGSAVCAGQALAALPDGQSAWLWASRDHILIQDALADPDADRFRRHVQALRRGVAEIHGVLSRTGGAVSLRSSVRFAKKKLAAWAARHPELLGALGDAPAVTLDGAQQALAALDRGERVLFWFTDADSSGAPCLLLGTDRGSLRTQAQACAGEGRSTRGTLAQRSGWIEFKARAPMPGFVAALARWLQAHHAQCPALLALRGARITVRDGDVVTFREHNPRVWEHTFGEIA